MSDPHTRNLLQKLLKLLYQCDWSDPEKFYSAVKETEDYLRDTKPAEETSEEENERRFKQCMDMINNLQPGEIEALMGPEFMEEFRRVSQ